MGFNGTRLLNNKIKINKSKPQWTYLLFILFFFLLILEKVLVTQSSPFLWDSVEHSPPDFVHRILQARLLEWVVIPFSRGSFQLRDWIRASCTAGRFFTIWSTKAGDTGDPVYSYLSSCELSLQFFEICIFFIFTDPLVEVEVLLIQLCLTLCNSTDCSPPGSSVHGILQARILEWVNIRQTET